MKYRRMKYMAFHFYRVDGKILGRICEADHDSIRI